MPRKSSEPKKELVATRVTPFIKDIIAQEARKEGLDISEWLRDLVVRELRRREALPPRY